MKEEEDIIWRDDLRLGITIPSRPPDDDNACPFEVERGLVVLKEARGELENLGDEAPLLFALPDKLLANWNWFCDEIVLPGDGFGKIGTTDLEEEDLLLEFEAELEVLDLLDLRDGPLPEFENIRLL